MRKNLPKSWMDHEAQRLLREFDEVGKTLIWQLQQGGGVRNIHIANTIRELDRLYWVNAAYQKAVEDGKG